MNNNILINIPHSSIKLPNEFYEKLNIDREYLKEEINILTDYYTDDLFNVANCSIIKSEYSRLFCDVERFKDDNLEIMSKIGMGVVYLKTTKGDKLINIDGVYKENIIKEYYDVYHDNFNNITSKILSKYGKCLIIDAHSFSEDLIIRLNGKEYLEEFPDICIGFEEEFVEPKIIDIISKKFIENGFTVKFNFPYKGSIVPVKYYKLKDKRVKSIMIEINKKTYLNSDYQKNDNYLRLKVIISEIIKEISINDKN